MACNQCKKNSCQCVPAVIVKKTEVNSNEAGNDGLSAMRIAQLTGEFTGTTYEEFVEWNKGKDGGTIFPDEEDITVVNDEGDLNLKFKDREPDETDFVPLGNVILRRKILTSRIMSRNVTLTGSVLRTGQVKVTINSNDYFIPVLGALKNRTIIQVGFEADKTIPVNFKGNFGGGFVYNLNTRYLDLLKVVGNNRYPITNRGITYAQRMADTKPARALFTIGGFQPGEYGIWTDNASVRTGRDLNSDGVYYLETSGTNTWDMFAIGNTKEIRGIDITINPIIDVDRVLNITGNINLSFQGTAVSVPVIATDNYASIVNKIAALSVPGFTITKKGSFLIEVTKDTNDIVNGPTVTVTSTDVPTKIILGNDGRSADTIEAIVNRFTAYTFPDIEVSKISNSIINFKSKTVRASSTIAVNTVDTGLTATTSIVDVLTPINTLSDANFKANTEFLVQYDYDLNGNTLTLPANVTLIFEGGCIRNGTIVGNNTTIQAEAVKVFDTFVNFQGTFKNLTVLPEWFGAIPFPIELEDGVVMAGTLDIDNKVDCTRAINKALQLSALSGGECYLGNGCYKTTDTIIVGDYCTLFIESKCAIIPKITGVGTDQLKPIKFVAYNSYVATEKMIECINLSVIAASIKGRGMLLMKYCSFSIGVLINGIRFKWSDMTFRPYIDITIIDAKFGQTVPDSLDLHGNGLPTAAIGVNGDYYIDDTTGKMYFRNNSGVWNFYRDVDYSFNTAVRFDCRDGDRRVINTEGYLWNQYGFRGIEFITMGDPGYGGWCNDSKWRGTISNKSGNFVSFFSAYDLDRHNLSGMNYQTGTEMSSEGKIIYGNARNCDLGRTWDLGWSASGYKRGGGIKYHLTPNSRGNYLVLDAEKFLLDEGTNNNVTTQPFIMNKDAVISNKYKNLFSKMSPTNVSVLSNEDYTQFNTFRTDYATMFGELVANDQYLTNGHGFPKELFDEDDSTKVTVVDTDNNLFGTGFTVYNRFEPPTTHARYLCIEYGFNNLVGTVKPNGYFNIVISTPTGDFVQKVIQLPDNQIGGYRMKLQKFFYNLPISSICRILFVPVDNVAGISLQIHAVKLFVDSSANFDYLDKQREFSARFGYNDRGRNVDPIQSALRYKPKGSLNYDTKTQSVIVNNGENEDFVPVALTNNFFNLLDGRTPVGLLTPGNNIRTAATTALALAMTPSYNGGAIDLPKNLFDGSSSGSLVVLDPANNIFGSCIGLFSNTYLKDKTLTIYIELELFITGTNPNATDFRVVVSDNTFIVKDNPYKSVIEKSIKNRVGGTDATPTYWRNKVFLRLQEGDLTRGGLLFYANTAVTGNTLVLKSMKLWVDSKELILDNKAGTTANRPTAVGTGHIYYNTTLVKAEINTGTTTAPVWSGLTITP